MKKWLILGSVGILLVASLVVVAFIGRGGHEGFATKADVAAIKGSVDKLTTSVSTLTGLVGEVNGKAEKLENQRKLDLSNVKSQAEIEGLKRDVKDLAKTKDLEREISELKLKIAGAATTSVAQYVLPQFVPVSPPPSAYRYGSFGITQSGRYSFIIEPYYAVFSVDGQRVSNGQIIYLQQGWHNWTADSDMSFRNSWVGY